MTDDYDGHVPESERVDDDRLDPNSVANRDGSDLSNVDPDAGDIVDLAAMEDPR